MAVYTSFLIIIKCCAVYLLTNRKIGKTMNRELCAMNFFCYLCTRIWRNAIFDAEIAQLVEHNLAKVGVAGPSPVFRSHILKQL